MSFLTKWRLFAWTMISSPVWLLPPLVAIFGIGGHFLFITLLFWCIAGIYVGPHKLLRCPKCRSSMLSWRKSAKLEDRAGLQVYLLLSLFSSRLAANYLGDLHCPHCGQLLFKKPL